jgi:hypothetical protein
VGATLRCLPATLTAVSKRLLARAFVWLCLLVTFGRHTIRVRCSYDDMVESVRKLAQLGVQLTVEERNLLSVAYKVRGDC